MRRRLLRLNKGKLPGKTQWIDLIKCILVYECYIINLVFFSLKPSNWFFSAGDEAQVNLAVVQASHKDSGVYRCTITNEYGTDSTDCLLSGESTYSFIF